MRCLLIVCLLASVLCLTPEIFEINLDLPPRMRYSQLGKAKKEYLLSFIDYLYGLKLYRAAFWLVRVLEKLIPGYLASWVGEQFYEEAASLADAVGRPVSELIVFNYMYELGAQNNFCTSIAVRNGSSVFLARNLDYGFQEFLSRNSVLLRYTSGGRRLFETVGHAGLIGTHTALAAGPAGYAITLNQRVQGGLRRTLRQILRGCQTAPYLLINAFRQFPEWSPRLLQFLLDADTCAAVYYIVNCRQGNFLIEKDRGVGGRLIEVGEEPGVIVQANDDWDAPDREGRKTSALQQIHELIERDNLTQAGVLGILEHPPVFNRLTLITSLLDVGSGEVSAEVWYQ